jgi:hypothetical protein
MRRLLLPTLAGLLATTTLAQAQPFFRRGDLGRSPSAVDLALYWHRSYLRRPASPAEVRDVAGQLRRGTPPAEVLSRLLGSGEYFDLAGGTREGFIARLIQEVGHRDPTRREVRDYLDRARGMDRREVALMFLRRYGPNWYPGPGSTTPADFYELAHFRGRW